MGKARYHKNDGSKNNHGKTNGKDRKKMTRREALKRGAQVVGGLLMFPLSRAAAPEMPYEYGGYLNSKHSSYLDGGWRGDYTSYGYEYYDDYRYNSSSRYNSSGYYNKYTSLNLYDSEASYTSHYRSTAYSSGGIYSSYQSYGSYSSYNSYSSYTSYSSYNSYNSYHSRFFSYSSLR